MTEPYHCPDPGRPESAARCVAGILSGPVFLVWLAFAASCVALALACA